MCLLRLYVPKMEAKQSSRYCSQLCTGRQTDTDTGAAPIRRFLALLCVAICTALCRLNELLAARRPVRTVRALYHDGTRPRRATRTNYRTSRRASASSVRRYTVSDDAAAAARARARARAPRRRAYVNARGAHALHTARSTCHRILHSGILCMYV